jgi:hypothetical protein
VVHSLIESLKDALCRTRQRFIRKEAVVICRELSVCVIESGVRSSICRITCRLAVAATNGIMYGFDARCRHAKVGDYPVRKSHAGKAFAYGSGSCAQALPSDSFMASVKRLFTGSINGMADIAEQNTSSTEKGFHSSPNRLPALTDNTMNTKDINEKHAIRNTLASISTINIID